MLCIEYPSSVAKLLDLVPNSYVGVKLVRGLFWFYQLVYEEIYLMYELPKYFFFFPFFKFRITAITLAFNNAHE